MSENIAIIGGDLRNVKVAEILQNKGNKVYIYGLENAEELRNQKSIKNLQNIKSITEDIKTIIGPTPFSKDGIYLNAPFGKEPILIDTIIKNLKDKVLIAGAVSTEIIKKVENSLKIIDIMKNEKLAILNTIATAEGTIELTIANTDKILHGSRILILGFGRVARILAKKMMALSAKVTCAARKEEDFAWMHAYGYRKTNINELSKNLEKYDIIINTVPHLILTKEKLQYVNKNALIIDLASKPGGIDKEEAKRRNLKVIWALALPGKVAPLTSAEFITETIENIIKENKLI